MTKKKHFNHQPRTFLYLATQTPDASPGYVIVDYEKPQYRNWHDLIRPFKLINHGPHADVPCRTEDDWKQIVVAFKTHHGGCLDTETCIEVEEFDQLMSSALDRLGSMEFPHVVFHIHFDAKGRPEAIGLFRLDSYVMSNVIHRLEGSGGFTGHPCDWRPMSNVMETRLLTINADGSSEWDDFGETDEIHLQVSRKAKLERGDCESIMVFDNVSPQVIRPWMKIAA